MKLVNNKDVISMIIVRDYKSLMTQMNFTRMEPLVLEMCKLERKSSELYPTVVYSLDLTFGSLYRVNYLPWTSTIQPSWLEEGIHSGLYIEKLRR